MLLLLNLTPTSFAQESSSAGDQSSEDTFFCTEGLSLEDIALTINDGQEEVRPQETITFSGVIDNQTNLAIVNAELRARVWREGDGGARDMVDTYIVDSKVTLPATQQYSFSDEWYIPANVAAGKYVIEYGLALLGDAEAVTKNSPEFTIVSENQPVTFLTQETQVNGIPYSVEEGSLVVSNKDITLKTVINNPTDEDVSVPLQWNIYAGDSANKERRLYTSTSVVTVPANSQQEVSYSFENLSEGSLFATALMDHKSTKSFLNISIIPDDTYPRLLFAGLAPFPLSEREENQLSYCVAIGGGNNTANPYNLSLEVVDSSSEQLVSSLVVDPTEPVNLNFTSNNLNTVLLKVAVLREGVPVGQTEVVYDCNDINPATCFSEGSAQGGWWRLLIALPVLITVGVVVLVTGLIVWLIRRRKQKNPKDKSSRGKGGLLSLIALAVLGTGLILPTHAEAKSVSWSGTVPHQYQLFWKPANQSNMETYNISNTVTYSATLRNLSDGRTMNDGATVKVGDQIQVVVAPLTRNDIKWSPGGAGTPYDDIYLPNIQRNGYVGVTSAAPTNSCTPENISLITRPLNVGPISWFGYGDNGISGYPVSSGTNYTGLGYTFSPTAVNPPSTSVSATGANCSGTICTVTSPGSVAVQVNFAETDLAIYARSASSETPSVCSDPDPEGYPIFGWYAPAIHPIPAQSISFTLQSSEPVPQPAIDLKVNGSDGPVTILDTDTAQLSWTSNGVSTCNLYGAGLSGGTVVTSGNTSVPGSMITNSPETYVLSCEGLTDAVVVNVTDTNQPPNAPTITGPTNAETSQSNAFGFRATDPDGDQVVYDIDWTNNNVTDVTSAFVNSGTAITGYRSWSTAGTYTFRARARDTSGAASSWTQHTITITQSAPPTATIEASVNNGSWSSSNVTIGAQDDVRIRWSSANASSCSAASGSGFSASGTSGTDNSVNEPAAGNNETFSVNCGGATASVTVTSELADLSIAAWVLDVDQNSFNGTTYGNGTVRFTHSNVTSRSAVPATTATLSYGSNPTVNTPGLSGGQEYGGQLAIPISNINLGTFSANLTVNQPQSVNEKTRSNNTVTVTGAVPPPNPGLFIRADRIQVRPGDTVQLTWGATNPYPMNCRVQGPGVDETSTNTIPAGTADPAISAKSEYTITCTHPAATAPFSASVVVETIGVLEEV